MIDSPFLLVHIGEAKSVIEIRIQQFSDDVLGLAGQKMRELYDALQNLFVYAQRFLVIKRRIAFYFTRQAFRIGECLAPTSRRTCRIRPSGL